METIGIRKLKENLSYYMNRVKIGEGIIVTDRKRKIAVILPFEKGATEEKIYRLIQQGVASWSGGKPEGMPDRVVAVGASVSDAVVEDRR